MALFVDRLALLRSGTVLSSPQGAVSPVVQVNTAGSITPPRGRGALRIDPSIARTLEQILASAGPAVSSAANRLFVPLAQRIVEQWPVATGLSRASFAVLVTETPSGVKLSIVNTAEYADRIGGDDDVARELIFEPAEGVADQMADAIAQEIG